jgi:hypothetical protein
VRRGRFSSVSELVEAIELWVEHWNDDPKPFHPAQDRRSDHRQGRCTHRGPTRSTPPARREPPRPTGANSSTGPRPLGSTRLGSAQTNLRITRFMVRPIRAQPGGESGQRSPRGHRRTLACAGDPQVRRPTPDRSLKVASRVRPAAGSCRHRSPPFAMWQRPAVPSVRYRQCSLGQGSGRRGREFKSPPPDSMQRAWSRALSPRPRPGAGGR